MDDIVCLRYKKTQEKAQFSYIKSERVVCRVHKRAENAF